MPQGPHLLAHDDVTDVIASDFASKDSKLPAEGQENILPCLWKPRYSQLPALHSFWG